MMLSPQGFYFVDKVIEISSLELGMDILGIVNSISTY